MPVALPYPYPDDIPMGQWDPYALLRNLQYLAESIDAFPVGAVVLLASGSTCPTGWTLKSTNNGSYLRLNTSAAGGTGGSLTTGAGGTGSTGSSGSHAHSVSASGDTTLVDAGAYFNTSVATGMHTHSTDTEASHTHTGPSHTHTLAPTYFDVIVCVKT